VRGEQTLDLTPVADAAVRVGALVAQAQGQISSIDANPMGLGRAGEPSLVLDALVEIAAPAQPGAVANAWRTPDHI
jgi:hypothetical protein